MADSLSADEIAKLFASAKDGEAPEQPRAVTRKAPVVGAVDFSRPKKLNLVEQRRFEHAHGTFCGSTSDRLTSEMRADIELEIINSSQLTWEGALGDVPQPSILGVAECEPGASTVVIAVEQALVLRMIESMLGGVFSERQAPRPLTEIDSAIARDIFGGLLTALSPVWRELLGVGLSLVDFETHNTTLELHQPSQPTLELTIEVRDPSSSSTIMLLVPYTTIEAAPKSLGGQNKYGGAEADPGAAQAVRTALGAVSVEVRAEIGAVGLTLGEVLGLGEGDIVKLGAAGDALITVDGDHLIRARPGLSGTRRAVQVIEPVGVSDER